MTDHSLPNEVVSLLRDHISSYDKLELLLVFARDRDRDWSPASVADALGVPQAVVDTASEDLCAAGLLVRDGIQLRPHPAAVASLESLAATYRDCRIELMNQMTKFAMERVRTSALRAFAGAFELGRKHDG